MDGITMLPRGSLYDDFSDCPGGGLRRCGLGFFALGQREDLFINPGIAKLTVLTARGTVTQSTELVGSPKMESLIKEPNTAMMIGMSFPTPRG